mmetsp:Transcript_12953/g.21914  ORF Transcript_12953/g.21914 Transcript_12953/m.21914 type:complete len:235 (+) Transcript_12953:218-922(+)
MGDQALKSLKIKDLAEQQNIQLRHPLCFECFGEILAKLKFKIKKYEAEKKFFKEEIAQLDQELNQTEKYQTNLLQKELAELQLEEKKLLEEERKLDEEERQQTDLIRTLEGTKSEIESQERVMWLKMNDYEKDLVAHLEKNMQVEGQLATLSQQTSKFQRTCFLNEIFFISSQDQFGTISGFRLGTISNTIDVQWDEINVALGQAVYLLAILAHRFGFKFEKYKINLCGARSTI